MLGNMADSSDFVMAPFGGHSFVKSVHSLDSYTTTFFVDSHICGQRTDPMFSERPREKGVAAPPPSLCVGHFGELLEDWSSSQRRD